MMARILFLCFVFCISLSGSGWCETVQLQGAIRDESGKPVAGAELFLYDSENTRRPADYISRRTGTDGRFSMKIPSGHYWSVARLRHSDIFGPLRPGDLHSGEPREIDTAEGPGEIVFTVADIRELSRTKEKKHGALSRIGGKVLDHSGVPVAAATVYVWIEPLSERLPDAMSSWTEADGEYSLYLLPGSYQCMASTAFPPTGTGRRMLKLTIAENRKDVQLNLPVTATESTSTGGAHQHADGVSLDDE